MDSIVPLCSFPFRLQVEWLQVHAIGAVQSWPNTLHSALSDGFGSGASDNWWSLWMSVPRKCDFESFAPETRRIGCDVQDRPARRRIRSASIDDVSRSDDHDASDTASSYGFIYLSELPPPARLYLHLSPSTPVSERSLASKLREEGCLKKTCLSRAEHSSVSSECLEVARHLSRKR